MPSLDLLSLIRRLGRSSAFPAGGAGLRGPSPEAATGSGVGRRRLILARSHSLSGLLGPVTVTSRAIAPRALSPWMSSFTTIFFSFVSP
jgi:hypothetical protein